MTVFLLTNTVFIFFFLKAFYCMAEMQSVGGNVVCFRPGLHRLIVSLQRFNADLHDGYAALHWPDAPLQEHSGGLQYGNAEMQCRKVGLSCHKVALQSHDASPQHRDVSVQCGPVKRRNSM